MHEGRELFDLYATWLEMNQGRAHVCTGALQWMHLHMGPCMKLLIGNFWGDLA